MTLRLWHWRTRLKAELRATTDQLRRAPVPLPQHDQDPRDLDLARVRRLTRAAAIERAVELGLLEDTLYPARAETALPG